MRKALDPERFNELVESTGLAQLVATYGSKGYYFRLMPPNSKRRGTLSIVEQRIILLDPRDFSKLDFNEQDLFISLMCHEIGHCELYEQGRDHADEDLAWQVAETICPKPLPAQWETIKEFGLKNYAPRVPGMAIPNSGLSMIQNSICPNCGVADIGYMPKQTHLQNNGQITLDMRCDNCDREFRVQIDETHIISGNYLDKL